jgi:hypothetical protein
VETDHLLVHLIRFVIGITMNQNAAAANKPTITSARAPQARSKRDWAGSIRTILLSLVLAPIASGPANAADSWPQFRGPGGRALSDAKGLPVTWSESRNVKWKTPIHGKAWSSPVILGDQVWVTTATEDGRELFAVCVDRESGKIVHDLKLFTVPAPQYADRFNSYGSPSPVIEPGRVYVTFGYAGTACLDTATGRVLWERRDIKVNHYRGPGSSPIVFRDLLIMHFDGSDAQFVIALDKQTGRTVWQTPRSVDFGDLLADGKPIREGDFRKAFSTPFVAELDGRPALLSAASKAT